VSISRRRLAAAVVAVGLALSLVACATPPPPGSTPPIGSMGAMGDSITRAFDACTFLQECLPKSWATGTDPSVLSHYQRLVARNPAMSGRVFNAAKVGATSADLPGEAAVIAAHRPDYVTVLVGSNDACAADESLMTSRAVFRARIDQALTTVYTARPDTKMLVTSVPDLYRLWQVARNNTTAQLVWSAGFCRSMLDNPTSNAAPDESRRQHVRSRVVIYNTELAASCAAHPGCRFDGNAVFDYPFAIGDLSHFDFFHPSAAGQATLSAVTWARSGL
jgi:lysophospholipase L1-like esterase